MRPCSLKVKPKCIKNVPPTPLKFNPFYETVTNNLCILPASSVDGEGPDAEDIESPRSPRDNCVSSCENSLDERGSNRGSLLRIIRGMCYVVRARFVMHVHRM